MKKPKVFTDCKTVEDVEKYFPEARRRLEKFMETGTDLMTGDRAQAILESLPDDFFDGVPGIEPDSK